MQSIVGLLVSGAPMHQPFWLNWLLAPVSGMPCARGMGVLALVRDNNV